MQSLFAQKQDTELKNEKPWFIGINGGVNLFYGDIKFNSFWPAPKLHEIQPGAGFILGRTMSPALKLSSEFNFTALQGMKELLPDTLGFKTQALSLGLKGQLNPFALLDKKNTKLAFYIESGVGLMTWKTLLQNKTTLDTLNNLGWSNSNKKFAFYIPAGIHLEYEINSRFSTWIKSNYTIVFSDLLDGQAIGGFDRYSYTAFGFNYHFGKQKEAPKLLPYNFIDIANDSIDLSAKESIEPEKKILVAEPENPFSLTYTIPEKAPQTGFDVSVAIAKTGISSNGFFRLMLPSGFIPQAASNKEVSFTKLGYRYEYDFRLPMNQDSTKIQIHINLNEIENGIFPILIEGEIMDPKGKIFPIRYATYIEIVSETEWQQEKAIREQKKEPLQKTPENPVIESKAQTNVIEPLAKQRDSIQEKQKEQAKNLYRIQILASKIPYLQLDNFKEQHKITEDVFVVRAEGWYRYNIYETSDKNEAHRLCNLVRTQNNIPQAFVVYYKNGKRVLVANTQKEKAETISSQKSKAKLAKTTLPVPSRQEENQSTDNKIIYRIEIALVYDKPIPLYILQNKIGREKISEFKQNQTYIYTVGEFDDIDVARAFLDYVKTQFSIETAQIGQYQNNTRIKVIF